MVYKRVTAAERALIYRWMREGQRQSEIARRLARNPGSISREIRRNTGLKGYRPRQAHERAEARAKRPRPRRFTAAVRADAEARLKEGWTPEIIGQRARLEGRPHVCKETIYKHIYADAKTGGTLWKNLPRSRRERRRRCPRKERGPGGITNQRMIDTRPAEVETRRTVGHWEGDLIIGANGTGNLATLVERSTRFTLVGRTGSKEAQEVTDKICGLFKALPLRSRLSLTLDNGKEFAWHEDIARDASMDVYFAHPYHAWERGSNENVNGLIRRLYPKRSSFAGIGGAQLKRIDRFLNDRPRKCLGWWTPREKLVAFLVYGPCVGQRHLLESLTANGYRNRNMIQWAFTKRPSVAIATG